MKISLHLQEKFQIPCHGRKDSITYRCQLPPLSSRWSSPDCFISSASPSPTKPQRAKVSRPHCWPPPGSVRSNDPHSAPRSFVRKEPFRAVYIVSQHIILYHYASCPSPSNSRDFFFFFFFLEYNCFPML